jgi:hypothetical protein
MTTNVHAPRRLAQSCPIGFALLARCVLRYASGFYDPGGTVANIAAMTQRAKSITTHSH